MDNNFNNLNYEEMKDLANILYNAINTIAAKPFPSSDTEAKIYIISSYRITQETKKEIDERLNILKL